MPGPQLPRVCAVTFVKDDYFFLSKWISHYGEQLGKEHLFVISHGGDITVRELCRQINTFSVPSREDDSIGHKRYNIDRFVLINNFCNGLIRYFDYVLFCDVDEYVVVDPKRNCRIPEYLRAHPEPTTLTPLGLNVYQKRSVEPQALDPDRPVLSQRRYCKLVPLFCKPLITRIPLKRSSGNHASNDSNLFIAPDLYTFHFKFCDYNLSMNMHYNRHMGKLNQRYSRDLDLKDRGHEFPLRNSIDNAFASFDRLPVRTNFDFDKEREVFRKSWRRRRFLLQKAFWQSLLTDRKGDYSFHWRFDFFDSYHANLIPDRFTETL